MTGITRRRLFALATGAAFATTIRPIDSFAQDAHQHMAHGAGPCGPDCWTAFASPPLIEPDASGVVKLKVQAGWHSFEEGSEAASAGVNGAYLGPLVRLKNGETVTLSVENGMDDETTLHWHGLFVPPYSTAAP